MVQQLVSQKQSCKYNAYLFKKKKNQYQVMSFRENTLIRSAVPITYANEPQVKVEIQTYFHLTNSPN